MLRIEARRTAREGTPPDKYRTCCNCCNVKLGTVTLGIIETCLASLILVSIVQQVIWKSRTLDQCYKNFLRDCLIFKFRHFNITLVFDYIIALMMIFIILSVLLMFCGILSDTSTLLFPHLFVQAFFLLFSVGYFFLYAWSYFYGDIYTNNDSFQIQALLERMWLASLLLLLAAFQTYLFTSVVRCSLYLSKIEAQRRRRESAFERCSERVRLAKENGLWRTASWGGGFVQYKGQYDENKPIKEKKAKSNAHVQWGANIVVGELKSAKFLRQIEERYELPVAKPEYSPEKSPEKLSRSSSQASSSSITKQGQSISPPRVSLSHRISDSSHNSDTPSHHGSARAHKAPVTAQIRQIDGIKGTDRRASIEMKTSTSSARQYGHRNIGPKRDERFVRTESRTSSSSGSPPKREWSRTSGENEAAPLLAHHHQRSKRPPLRTHKSVDSTTMMEPPILSIPPGRRRSSLGAEEHSFITTHQKMGLAPEKSTFRVESPHHFVKKVSITSTGAPFIV
ncbi:unnamed protein product, partial [Mesorhabditis belari]|uniref:Uncharacterized protein n=1 Tax=Mesorhabditis belari TaxID=2138241 RepID=A0AAF3FB41_9BILA